jgi:hypothetical protein
VSPLHHGVSLIYCEPSKPRGDSHSYSNDPEIYGRIWLSLLAVTPCYWLLFRRRIAKKTRISAVHAGSFAVFSLHYQRKQRRLRRGGELR